MTIADPTRTVPERSFARHARLAPDCIAHHAAVAPEKMACEDLLAGRKRSYGELHARVARLAGALRAQARVRPGDRVLVLSRNDPDVFEIQFACQRLGAVFVPLNWRLSVRELQAIAADAEAAALLYSAEFSSTAAQVALVTSFRLTLEMRCGLPSEYERLIAQAEAPLFESEASIDDTWALIYTSGTTGLPKGVQISYRMALCNAMVLGQAFHITSDAKNLVLLPTYHTGGLNVFANPVFLYGGTNLILREVDPPLVLDLITREHGAVTHMLGVPTVHAMLVQEPAFTRIEPGHLQEVAVAGAPCPHPVLEAYARAGLHLRQCWGMTEVGPLATISPRNPVRQTFGSSGLATMFVQTRIVDRSNNELPDGEIGELLVRGPSVTVGYWQRPDATRAAFTDDGWFHTGDAAYRDKDGHHYIVDRWKDMFISGGENVYPAEIEHVLRQAPGVRECAVIGVPHDKWGEVGRAYVVAKADGAPPDAALLLSHCERHLARYKIPKEVVFVDRLPYSATGKVLKNELRARAFAHPVSEKEGS